MYSKKKTFAGSLLIRFLHGILISEIEVWQMLHWGASEPDGSMLYVGDEHNTCISCLF
jgi:hypothetical protein